MSNRSQDIRRQGEIAGTSCPAMIAARLIELQGPACGRFMR